VVLFQAVIVRPLSAVAALVRFAEEPQMFAIDFSDGCPMHVRSLSATTSLMFIYVSLSYEQNCTIFLLAFGFESHFMFICRFGGNPMKP
jgi:DnaJ family protein C protein 13